MVTADRSSYKRPTCVNKRATTSSSASSTAVGSVDETDHVRAQLLRYAES